MNIHATQNAFDEIILKHSGETRKRNEFIGGCATYEDVGLSGTDPKAAIVVILHADEYEETRHAIAKIVEGPPDEKDRQIADLRKLAAVLYNKTQNPPGAPYPGQCQARTALHYYYNLPPRMVVCVLQHGHAGMHRCIDGMGWNDSSPSPTPVAKATDPKLLELRERIVGYEEMFQRITGMFACHGVCEPIEGFVKQWQSIESCIHDMGMVVEGERETTKERDDALEQLAWAMNSLHAHEAYIGTLQSLLRHNGVDVPVPDACGHIPDAFVAPAGLTVAPCILQKGHTGLHMDAYDPTWIGNPPAPEPLEWVVGGAESSPVTGIYINACRPPGKDVVHIYIFGRDGANQQQVFLCGRAWHPQPEGTDAEPFVALREDKAKLLLTMLGHALTPIPFEDPPAAPVPEPSPVTKERDDALEQLAWAMNSLHDDEAYIGTLRSLLRHKGVDTPDPDPCGHIPDAFAAPAGLTVAPCILRKGHTGRHEDASGVTWIGNPPAAEPPDLEGSPPRCRATLHTECGGHVTEYKCTFSEGHASFHASDGTFWYADTPDPKP